VVSGWGNGTFGYVRRLEGWEVRTKGQDLLVEERDLRC